MIGRTFGRLTVIRDTGKRTKARTRLLLCECVCGTETEVRSNNLTSGVTKSCGCLKRERASARLFKHGVGIESRTYRIWSAMRGRCNTPSNHKYPRYGGRGIRVCERWDDFQNFRSDMGEAPDGQSIDRIDNDGDYEPSNCRWATPKTQSRNKSTNRWLTHDGETRILTDWAKRAGVKSYVLSKRLARGWSVEETITGVRK